jgi:hypothetical protein
MGEGLRRIKAKQRTFETASSEGDRLREGDGGRVKKNKSETEDFCDRT